MNTWLLIPAFILAMSLLGLVLCRAAHWSSEHERAHEDAPEPVDIDAVIEDRAATVYTDLRLDDPGNFKAYMLLRSRLEVDR